MKKHSNSTQNIQRLGKETNWFGLKGNISMSKKGKLTKVEKFYIENNQNKDLKEVAKDLDRTLASVTKYSESLVDTKHVTKTRDNEEQSSVSDLMGRKEDRGVTIMTQAASELSDEGRSKRKQQSSKYKNSIFVIKKENE